MGMGLTQAFGSLDVIESITAAKEGRRIAANNNDNFRCIGIDNPDADNNTLFRLQRIETVAGVESDPSWTTDLICIPTKNMNGRALLKLTEQ